MTTITRTTKALHKPYLTDHTLQTIDIRVTQQARTSINFAPFLNQVQKLDVRRAHELAASSNSSLSDNFLELLTGKEQKKKGERSHQMQALLREETELSKEEELERLRDNWGNLTEEEKQGILAKSVDNLKEANKQHKYFKNRPPKIFQRAKKLWKTIEMVEKEATPDQENLDELMAELDKEKVAWNEERASLVKALKNKSKAKGEKEAIKEMVESDIIVARARQETEKVAPLKRKSYDDDEDSEDDAYVCKRGKSISGTSKKAEAPFEKSDARSSFFLSEAEEREFFYLYFYSQNSLI